MKSNLQIKTKAKLENDATEPVSPTGEYFNSKSIYCCILAVMEFEVPIDDSCAVPQLLDVLLPLNPRFSSIMIHDEKGVRQWKKVEVNVEDHVIIPSFSEGLPIESYDDSFDEYLTKISKEILPENRPLWEVHIIKYPTSKAVGHVIFKFHHALGDGYSLMGALLSCVKRADNPSLPLTFPTTRTSSKVKSNDNRMGVMNSWLPRTISAIFKGASDFGWSFMKSTFKADGKTPIRSGNKDLGQHPLRISTVDLSLHHVKLIKTKLNSTVNDVLVGIIFLGLRLYMQAADTKFSNTPSTALVLFNTRNIRGYLSAEDMEKARHKIWGNNFAFLHIAMPALVNHISFNPLDFVCEAQKQITRLRNSPAVYLNAQCLEIMRKIKGPEAGAEHIHSTLNKSSMVITNMIGPIEKVAMADHPIKGMYFMVTGSPQSLVITILSYMQNLRIGLGIEEGFIDSKKLQSCINNAFELIYEAATKSE